TEGEDFFIRLSKSLRAGVYFIQRYPRIYQIYLKMLFQEDFPFRADLLKTIRLFSMDYLKPIVEEGIRRGELRQGLDPEVAAFFLDAVLDRFLQAYCIAYMDSGLGLFAHRRTEPARSRHRTRRARTRRHDHRPPHHRPAAATNLALCSLPQW
ncbi:MAG: hypothetical protein P8017_03870, partial [Deltaproteobacteria bacterium]